MNEIDLTSKTNGAGSDLWPMGAVTRRTGITEHTLRAWERRFGFPEPVRLPSGHRRFTNDQVRRLLLINRALASGYRAGDVVPLPVARVEALLRESDDDFKGSQPHVSAKSWVAEILSDALAFDEASIAAKMETEAAACGVSRFLRERAVPLIEELGNAWVRDEIGVRHEHFVSMILANRLHTMRVPFEATASGRPVVLACLPDEHHGLGLQMVALEIALAGRRLSVLGPNTPVAEIVASIHSLDAAAVGISISIYAQKDDVAKSVKILREELPKKVALWVGGAGAPTELPKGVVRLADLDQLAEVVRLLPD